MSEAAPDRPQPDDQKPRTPWIPWLIAAVAVAALFWTLASRREPTPQPQQQIVEPEEKAVLGFPAPCDPDHIITIEKECSAVPFELSQVSPGDRIWIKNKSGVEVVVEPIQGLFASEAIVVPAGGNACPEVITTCEAGTYTYSISGSGCTVPPIEARPRIVVRASSESFVP